MTLGVAAVFVGLLLVYAGVKGLAFTRLIVGDNSTPAPAGASVNG